MQNPTTVKRVSVVTTGHALAHHEHIYGSRKPSYWWIFFGKEKVRLPANAYVIEHESGLVLFDAGADPACDTDPNYWQTPGAAFFMRHIFEWEITPQDNLANQMELTGYDPTDVTKAVISHLHADHVGGIGDIPQANLYVAQEAWDHMLGLHPERDMVIRPKIVRLGAKWNPIKFKPTGDPGLAPFDEAFDLMGDGSMMVLPTPGHLAGAVSMLVRPAAGPPVLMIGDLTYNDEFLDHDRTPDTGERGTPRELCKGESTS